MAHNGPITTLHQKKYDTNICDHYSGTVMEIVVHKYYSISSFFVNFLQFKPFPMFTQLKTQNNSTTTKLQSITHSKITQTSI